MAKTKLSSASRIQVLERAVRKLEKRLAPPVVKIFVLPGGKMPERQTGGAAGYDVHLRAVVCPHEMDERNPKLRKLLFDFKTIPEDPKIRRYVVRADKNGREFPLHSSEGELVYGLPPGESVLVGIGFATEMPFPHMYWVLPRSGLASKYGIVVSNAPGTVDADYRGEAGVIVRSYRSTYFYLRHQMRVSQIAFQKVEIPQLVQVRRYSDLSQTARGAGGFGSTGIEAKK